MEDDLHGIQPHWKMAEIAVNQENILCNIFRSTQLVTKTNFFENLEDDLHGRQPHSKTCFVTLLGLHTKNTLIFINWKTTSLQDELNWQNPNQLFKIWNMTSIKDELNVWKMTLMKVKQTFF